MDNKVKNVRVRFAPSPTGYLHIGSARTALFNYLWAKKNNGLFILRIEDTDKERSSKEYEKDIIEGLKWLKIEFDIGPYRQSERKEIYKKYLSKLIEEDKAYYCFCTKEELEAKRQEQISRGLAPKYNGKCSGLSKKEVQENLKKGKQYIIRFKTPHKKIRFKDLIRGEIEFNGELIGDFAIARDINNPLYNFTVVVDDFEMKVNYVIRGEDLLPNTPKQIFLQEALGFQKPKYAHLPLILGPDRVKLSKRHGAVSLNEYRKQGYLPEAIINFLAFLGWNPGDEREFFSMEELIKEFSLEKVQKSPAIFNSKRLDYLNGLYIRQKGAAELTKMVIPYLIKEGFIVPSEIQKKIFQKNNHKKNNNQENNRGEVKNYLIKETKEKISFEDLKKIVLIYKERIKRLSEISELTDFFFKEKITYDKELLYWKEADEKETKVILDKIINILSNIEEGLWNKENLEKILLEKAGEISKDRGYMLWPLRVALTGKKFSAGPFEIAEILGKEKTIKRVEEAKNLFEEKQ